LCRMASHKRRNTAEDNPILARCREAHTAREARAWSSNFCSDCFDLMISSKRCEVLAAFPAHDPWV
jgi:hypothetical protein